ncbi:MAG: ABC transporter substrate-binding protein [Pseudomonadota bacterium]
MKKAHSPILGRHLLFSFIATLLFVSPASAQDRIVSVGGDVTEIIFALGEGDRVAAVDTTSVYPAETADLPKVGYMRQLSAEGVLSAEPDLIIISGAAGPETALQLLRDSGVPIIEMETEYTVDSIIEKTRRTAEAIGRAEEGETLVEQIKADWADAQKIMGDLDFSPSALFIAATQDGAARAAGAETAANGVIDLIGGENVFSDYTGYKTLSLEGAVAADPDIILMMVHHAGRIGGKENVAKHPALSLTNAAQTDNIYFVDQLEVMQFTPRTPKAVAALVTQIANERAKKQ